MNRATDLLLELHLDEGYSYNLMPSAPALGRRGPFERRQPIGIPFRRLAAAEKIGRKGRSLPGSHRSHGFMALAGPSIRKAGRLDAHIADLTATLLARLGVSVPPSFKGRVLWEALKDDRGVCIQSLSGPAGVDRRAARSEGLVESRLRALGYIE